MSKQLTALVIDDERLARKDLISLISGHPQIKVVAEADNVTTAMHAIEAFNPDVIFLDIQMPGESGFDLLTKINVTAKVIFVTAFDEYAIRAFEVNALDYLLKPVNPERLAHSIERLQQETESPPPTLRKLGYEDHLFLLIDNQMRFLKINTILSISSAGDYSEIVTLDRKKGLTLKSMKEWEYRLPEQYFCRIHRAAIINMEYIDRLEAWFNYSFRVYLKGIEQPYVMSRRFVANLRKRLG
ncbi:LytTR family DNA-binding domain-containing protein [candidate division KSB1 bacterium]|nr:LytTR family DNA-binding domain-containing protein [candidate division KSB1 bacterium]